MKFLSAEQKTNVGFITNGAETPAYPWISEPRNNTPSTLPEPRFVHLRILPGAMYNVSPVSILFLVSYLSAVPVTHHPQR